MMISRVGVMFLGNFPSLQVHKGGVHGWGEDCIRLIVMPAGIPPLGPGGSRRIRSQRFKSGGGGCRTATCSLTRSHMPVYLNINLLNSSMFNTCTAKSSSRTPKSLGREVQPTKQAAPEAVQNSPRRPAATISITRPALPNSKQFPHTEPSAATAERKHQPLKK